MKGRHRYRYSDVGFFFYFVVNPPSTAIAYDNDTVTFQIIARIVYCELPSGLFVCLLSKDIVCRMSYCRMFKYIHIFSILGPKWKM